MKSASHAHVLTGQLMREKERERHAAEVKFKRFEWMARWCWPEPVRHCWQNNKKNNTNRWHLTSRALARDHRRLSTSLIHQFFSLSMKLCEHEWKQAREPSTLCMRYCRNVNKFISHCNVSFPYCQCCLHTCTAHVCGMCATESNRKFEESEER